MNKMIIATLIISPFFLTTEVRAESEKPTRKPNQVTPCVTFNGEGAKKTFLALYPNTQGKVTAIAAEPSKLGDISISTKNIYCRVWSKSLPPDVDSATKLLSRMDPLKFQCGYFIYSDGLLEACSDPM